MDIMDTKELLTEAESTLFHISCILPLVYAADPDRYAVEMAEALQSLEQLSERTREKITNHLLLMSAKK